MTKTKTTKRALFASVLSLLLCVSMLIGSTFAWFTDTATTGVNEIQAGELDIAFMVKTAEDDKTTDADETTWADATTYGNLSFTNVNGETDILWEPGATFALPAVKLVNNGNLALKFNLFVNGLTGDMALAEVLEVIINGEALTNADGSAVTLSDLMADADGLAHGVLLPTDKTLPEGADSSYVKIGETGEYKIALHMAEEAGNEYQGLEISGMSLTAYATQYTYESDMTDNTYDENAIYADVLVSSVDEFKTALANAKAGTAIGFTAGTYDFESEVINIDKAVSIVGTGDLETELKNVQFDVIGSSATDKMEFTLYNLKITGVSRTVIGNRSYQNGVGGPDALYLSALTIRNCDIQNTIDSNTRLFDYDKGQFVLLYSYYTTKWDVTLIGNTLVNANTIDKNDTKDVQTLDDGTVKYWNQERPIMSGRGTVVNNVYIANNTIGSAEYPCEQSAIKIARRANGANIVVKDNTVYGASLKVEPADTSAVKNFALLDLYQSGANTQNDLRVSVTGNTINYTSNDDLAVYHAFIRASINGSNLNISCDGAILDRSVEK